MLVVMLKWTEDDLRLVLCQGQRMADPIWFAVLFSACFSECFGCFLWCAVQTYQGIWSFTVCLGVCFVGVGGGAFFVVSDFVSVC